MNKYPNIQAVIDGTVSGYMTEWPQLRAELIQLHADMTKIKDLVDNILVTQVEGREFMTSSQLHEAVIQDCIKALNI